MLSNAPAAPDLVRFSFCRRADSLREAVKRRPGHVDTELYWVSRGLFA